MNKKVVFSMMMVLGALACVPAMAQMKSTVSYRPKTAGLLGRFESLNDSRTTVGSSSLLYIDGFFGWNQVQYEFGPLLQYINRSGGTAGTFSRIAIGAYGDYNMVPNHTGERFVYGGTARLLIGQDNDSGGTGSLMSFGFGGVGKWYFSPTSTSALRFEFGYESTKTSAGGTSYTVNGLVGKAGFQTYF